MQENFTTWIFALILGIAILSLVPEQYAGWLIAIIVLGSIAGIYQTTKPLSVNGVKNG